MENEEIIKKEVVKDLVNHALDQIRMKYGSGEDGVESKKRYHNEKHTKAVRDEALLLGVKAVENGKISKTDLVLIEIATAFHDVEQDKGSGDNEKESARQAREMMGKSKLFNEEEIKKVEDMIMSTRVTFNDKGMSQSFVDSNNYLAQIIADADVANLGMESDYYWKCTTDFMREFVEKKYREKSLVLKPEQEIPLEMQINFLEDSVKLLTNHMYFTEEARAKYQNQTVNLEYTKKKLDELKSLKAVQS